MLSRQQVRAGGKMILNYIKMDLEEFFEYRLRIGKRFKDPYSFSKNLEKVKVSLETSDMDIKISKYINPESRHEPLHMIKGTINRNEFKIKTFYDYLPEGGYFKACFKEKNETAIKLKNYLEELLKDDIYWD